MVAEGSFPRQCWQVLQLQAAHEEATEAQDLVNYHVMGATGQCVCWLRKGLAQGFGFSAALSSPIQVFPRLCTASFEAAVGIQLLSRVS